MKLALDIYICQTALLKNVKLRIECEEIIYIYTLLKAKLSLKRIMYSNYD